MFRLYKYELKKILSQKYFILASVVLLLFMCGVNVTPLFNEALDYRDQRMVINNREIDDKLINEMYKNIDSKVYVDIVNFIKSCTRVNDFGVLNQEDVYNARLNTINKEMSVSCLTDDEYTYWSDYVKSIKIPFTYKCADAYSETLNIAYLVNFLSLILVSIALSGIFADEKQSGADQILYATKNGKSKLYKAKILSGITMGILLPIIEFGLLFGINLAIYGTQGYDAPIQLFVVESLLNMTMGEAMIYLFIYLLFASILYSVIVMFLSKVTNSHAASSAIMIMIMFLSMFNIPEKYRVISQIWHYVPAGHIGVWQFYEYRLLNIFGYLLNDLQASIILWTLVCIILIIIGKILNKNYQVLGR